METKIKYLVDTNIWLELLLEQEKANLVSKFFDNILPECIFISDFTLHSIGVILSKFKKNDVFEQFIDDLFVNAQIELLTLEIVDLLDVSKNIKKFNLDFDDSYQYTIAQKFDLTIVTFDKDFNISGLKRKSPEEIV